MKVVTIPDSITVFTRVYVKATLGPSFLLPLTSNYRSSALHSTLLQDFLNSKLGAYVKEGQA